MENLNQKSPATDVLSVISATVVSFFVTWWFIDQLSLILPTLASADKVTLFFPLSLNLMLLSSFYFLRKYWRKDTYAWELLGPIRICNFIDKQSKMGEKAESISDIVLASKHAIGNSSEEGFLLAVFLLQFAVYSLATVNTMDVPLNAVVSSMGFFFLMLIAVYIWILSPQKKYMEYKEFWKKYWVGILNLISIGGNRIGRTLDKGIPKDYFWLASDGIFVDDALLQFMNDAFARIKCNPITVDPDNEDFEDLFNASKDIANALDIIKEKEELINEIRKKYSPLQDSITFFEEYMDVLQSFRDGTIEKHLAILQGLDIVAVCPEAYDDIEMIRASEKTTDISLMNIASEELKKFESLPLFAIPNSIKIYIALATAFLALIPVAQMFLQYLF